MGIKFINVKGIAIVVAMLVVFQLAFGLVLSPILGKMVVDVINKSSDAKITIGSVNVWPLTLSFSMKDLRVYDPDDDKKLMIEVKKASAGMSFFALLSKKIVVSGVSLSGVLINLEGEPDGSFNVAKIAEPKEAPAKKTSVMDRFKKRDGGDWFSMVFNMVKNRSSKKAVEGHKETKKEARKIKTEVIELPKGRRVLFRTVKDEYLMQIKKLAIKNARIHVVAGGGQEIDVEKAGVSMTGIAIDPKKGATFDTLKVGGALRKGDKPAGSFHMSYVSKFVRDGVRTDVDVSARDVDLPAISFIYKDSLPVDVEKGILDLSSDTVIVNDSLDSKNKIVLTGHQLQPGSGKGTMVGVIPMSALCQALNQVDPLKLNFGITGTVDNPKFTGLEKTLQEVAKPYLKNIVEDQAKGVLEGFMKKETGAPAGGESGASEDIGKKAAESIKSLFKKK
ncbi:MAG: DUF748 domain-containing protein [Candidatus Omnitrophota bacterium]